MAPILDPRSSGSGGRILSIPIRRMAIIACPPSVAGVFAAHDGREVPLRMTLSVIGNGYVANWLQSHIRLGDDLQNLWYNHLYLVGAVRPKRR
jgi:hypothetical protein